MYVSMGSLRTATHDLYTVSNEDGSVGDFYYHLMFNRVMLISA